jgi:hypothetical protein
VAAKPPISPENTRLQSLLESARKALVLGIGGGGDVVGALTTARLCQEHGCEVLLGGVAWERMPIDPYPGPRPLEQIVNARPLADHVVLAGPDTRTAGGATLAEAHMARLLDEQTLLVDILGGPEAVASGLADAAARLGADLVIGVDVGGDVLGDGSEPGLASPLCDAVMLAAAALLAERGIETLGAVFGPCCDGELTIEELLDRLATLAAGGGLLGGSGMAPPVVAELEQVVEAIPTEASAQALRCARGEIGSTTIRSGRRQVTLSPLGAMTFYFDPRRAVATVAQLARAVTGARDLESANDVLHEIGVATELDFERNWVEA